MFEPRNTTFEEDIRAFNTMYRMRVEHTPSLQIGMSVVQRLKDFKSILAKELSEIDDIIAKAAAWKLCSFYYKTRADGSIDIDSGYIPTELEVLTDLADLFGDLQVYCASEMCKFGLPLVEVLGTIMESNFSKMGADGLPIYDSEGKLQKGPNYWKPEPKIAALLAILIGNVASNEAEVEAVQKALGAFDPLPGN